MYVKLGHNPCFVNVVCLIWTKAGNSFEFVRRIIVREFPLLPSPLITFWWPLRLICVWTHHHLWNFLLWSLTLGQYFYRPCCRPLFGKLIKTDYAKYRSKYYIYTEAHILEQKNKMLFFSFILLHIVFDKSSLQRENRNVGDKCKYYPAWHKVYGPFHKTSHPRNTGFWNIL